MSQFVFSLTFLFFSILFFITASLNKQGHPTNILLPRLVMHNPPPDYAVKFKDGDRLNMQKNNLFFVRYCRLAIKKEKRLRELAKERKSQEFNS